MMEGVTSPEPSMPRARSDRSGGKYPFCVRRVASCEARAEASRVPFDRTRACAKSTGSAGIPLIVGAMLPEERRPSATAVVNARRLM